MGSLQKSLVLFFLIFVWTSCKSWNQPRKNQDRDLRPPAVAGTFYPASAEVLEKTLAGWLDSQHTVEPQQGIRAMIVPHAGYIYSGEVAAAAYRQLDETRKYRDIFIIGPAHYTGFKGASICLKSGYKTPLGIVPVDLEIANKLIREHPQIMNVPDAHRQEHCIEVQLPYLQYRLKEPFRIVPMLIGTQNPDILREISVALEPYFTADNLFIISSDLSHYPAYKDAIKADTRTLEAIEKNNPYKFLQALEDNARASYPNLVTSMCGAAPALILLNITYKKPNLSIQTIRYRNSGDVPGGPRDRVVGYGAVLITNGKAMETVQLSEKDKSTLLKLARKVLENKIRKGMETTINIDHYSKTLQEPMGAFVTLSIHGQLRGCIGRFQPDAPLVEVVRDMTISAALRDPRFPPVKKEELDSVEIEISVLTPLRKIESPEEFILGKHGIYMVRGGRSGTFLPQVAQTTGWSREEFLGHCARDKAGIGWDGWKTADLYVYEAIIFSEGEFNK